MSLISKIIEYVALALEEDVTVNTNTENCIGWDSLGHLSILSALDQATNGEINKIRDFNNVSSVKELIELFEKHKIDL